MEFLDPEDAIAGPSLILHSRFAVPVLGGHMVDDDLSQEEMDLICGVYRVSNSAYSSCIVITSNAHSLIQASRVKTHQSARGGLGRRLGLRPATTRDSGPSTTRSGLSPVSKDFVRVTGTSRRPPGGQTPSRRGSHGTTCATRWTRLWTLFWWTRTCDTDCSTLYYTHVYSTLCIAMFSLHYTSENAHGNRACTRTLMR